MACIVRYNVYSMYVNPIFLPVHDVCIISVKLFMWLSSCCFIHLSMQKMRYYITGNE